MRPASLGYAVAPTAVYESTRPDGARAPRWYTLDDAKTFLNIDLDDTSDDVRITHAVREGIAYLEEMTGRRFKSTAMTAEYGNLGSGHRVIKLDVEDAIISTLHRVDAEGVETLVAATDYDLVYMSDQAHIRLHADQEAFDPGYGVCAKVAFTTEMSLDSSAAQVARAVMNDWVKWVIDEDDKLGDPRNRAHFVRAVSILTDKGGSSKGLV